MLQKDPRHKIMSRNLHSKKEMEGREVDGGARTVVTRGKLGHIKPIIKVMAAN